MTSRVFVNEGSGEMTETKESTKKLIRPYAAILFFSRAIHIALDELSLIVTDWVDSTDPVQYARGLRSMFNETARSIKVHTDHQIRGLYPEIQCFIEDTMSSRHLRMPSDVELQLSLARIPMLAKEHCANIQRIRDIQDSIVLFAEKVKANRDDLDENEEIQSLFERITESIKSWICCYKEHLEEEDKFLRRWIGTLRQNKVDEIKLVKSIIDANRDLVLRHQFGFIVSKLVVSEDWMCWSTNHQYTRNETLAAYIRSLQMLSTEEEYSKILSMIPKHIPNDIWCDLKRYDIDLGGPGSFRYAQGTTETKIADVCSQNVACYSNDEQCLIN